MKTSVQDLLATLKSREEDQTHQYQPPKKKCWRQTHDQTKNGEAKDKPIFSKPKARTDFTSYLIDVFWDDRLC